MVSLTKATFQLPGTTQPISKAYNESLSYDSNGNILKLERFGKKQVNQGIELDDLTYIYEGNILKKVVDATNNADGFKQGTHTGDDYTYDTFGNLKTDKNKGITNIKYNHLNLPVEITFGNGKIEYIYSAGGAKVQKKVTQGTTVTTTDYLGGFQYTNNVLEFFPTPEGYYDARNSRYVYQYADHLGNTRLSYSDINKNDIVEANEILSEADYYPFGLQHTENSIATTANKAAEKYQYNGKEFQDELNLNVTAMDFRMYDNALGRFYGIDKLSEVTPGITPFHFGYNSPLLMSDPSGLLSQSLIQSLWDNSSSSGWNSWTNNGGDFFNNSGTIGINGINGERTNYEGLPNIDISPRFTASQNGILVQDHVYKTAGGYQYFRDGLREKSLDNLQHSLDVIGTVPGLGEAADLINSGISYGRGDYVRASLSLAATVPFIGVGATVAKAGVKSFQKHHIIPNQVYKNFKSDFIAMGWKQNDALNLKKLPTPFHSNHPAYNRFISEGVMELKTSRNFNLNSMQKLQHDIRIKVGDAYRSGSTLNEYFKTL